MRRPTVRALTLAAFASTVLLALQTTAASADELLRNGSFSQGLADWTQLGSNTPAGFSATYSPYSEGGGSARITVDGAAGATGVAQAWLIQCVVVQPGAPFSTTASSKVLSTSGTTQLWTYVVWYADSSCTALAPNPNGSHFYYEELELPKTSSWNSGTISKSIPAGVHSATFQVSALLRSPGVIDAAFDNASFQSSGNSPGQPQITSFASSQKSCSIGESVLLSWTTANATSASITPGLGYVPVNGSRWVSPASTTTYTLTASSGGVDRQSIVVVSVVPKPASPASVRFDAIPSPQASGQPFAVRLQVLGPSGEPLQYSWKATLGVKGGGTISPTWVASSSDQVGFMATLRDVPSSVSLTATVESATGVSNAIQVTGGASSTGSLTGTVRNSLGASEVDAEVNFGPPGLTSGTWKTRSTALGDFSLGSLPCGSANSAWAVSKAGVTGESVPVTIPCGRTATVSLQVSSCKTNGLTPVLMVPGLLGSTTENYWTFPILPKDAPEPEDSRWGGEETNRTYGLMDAGLGETGWLELKQSLQAAGYSYGCTIFAVPYDWRMLPADAVTTYLQPKIEKAKRIAGTQSVDVVAHSMGGLVTRAYIQGAGYAGDIRRFAMVGTPNHGASEAYPLWEGGDIQLVSSVYDRTLCEEYKVTFGTDICAQKRSTDPSGLHESLRTFIVSKMKSGSVLLPTYTFLQRPSGGSQSLSCSSNPFLPALNAVDLSLRYSSNEPPPSGRVQTKIFGATSESTRQSILTGAKPMTCLAANRYSDGEPTLDYSGLLRGDTSTGDGTVLSESARLGNLATDLTLAGVHSNLVEVYRDRLVEFLTKKNPLRATAGRGSRSASLLSTLSVGVRGPATLLVTDPSGRRAAVSSGTGLLQEIPGSEVTGSDESQGVVVRNPDEGPWAIGLTTNSIATVRLSLTSARPSTVDEYGYDLVVAGQRSLLASVDVNGKAQFDAALLPPKGLRVFPKGGDLSRTGLSWYRKSEAVSYRVYARAVNAVDREKIADTSEISLTTSLAWSGVLDGGRAYSVSAVLSDGGESFLSAEATDDDRDSDGISDDVETELGTNPDKLDTDGDGLGDGEERRLGTSPFSADTDGDGVGDLIEARSGTDPLSVDSVPPAGTASGSRLVPIVLDVASGTAHYTTELTLTNRGRTPAALRLGFVSAFSGGAGTVLDAIAPSAQVVIPDAIAYLRRSGTAGGAGSWLSSEGGSLSVTFDGAEATDSVSVQARTTTSTTSPLPEGSAGLAYAGLDLGLGGSDILTIPGARMKTSDRTNVAVFNVSPNSVTFRVTAFAGDASGRSKVVAEGVILPGYGWTQYSQVLIGTGFDQGWVTIEKTGGTGSLGAYGVINDNVTNDGSFLLPAPVSAVGSQLAVPVLVESAAFRSELVLTNRGTTPVTLTLRYVESSAPSLGAGGSTTILLNPKEQIVQPEAIDWLRGRGISIGPKDTAQFVGTLRVAVSGGALSDVYAGARTAARSGGGQFGLFTGGVYEGQEASTSAFVFGLRSDASNRSNVAMLHSGSEGSGNVTLEVRTYDGDDGGAEKGAALVVTLGPGGWKQFGNPLAAAGIRNGWARVTRTSGTAPWITYGVVNDGANPGERTGDGAYVPMVLPNVN